LRQSNTEPIMRIYAEGTTMEQAENYANRIKAVGLWFSGYSSDAYVLSPTPYAWLVPVGLDVLMPPNDPTFTQRRNWQVIDQKLPNPIDLCIVFIKMQKELGL